MPISSGLVMGETICASSVGARPSQNCDLPQARLMRVGVWRTPSLPSTPMESGVLARKAWAGSWQKAHETTPFAESRPSKKALCPVRRARVSKGYLPARERAGGPREPAVPREAAPFPAPSTRPPGKAGGTTPVRARISGGANQSPPVCAGLGFKMRGTCGVMNRNRCPIIIFTSR